MSGLGTGLSPSLSLSLSHSCNCKLNDGNSAFGQAENVLILGQEFEARGAESSVVWVARATFLLRLSIS